MRTGKVNTELIIRRIQMAEVAISKWEMMCKIQITIPCLQIMQLRLNVEAIIEEVLKIVISPVMVPASTVLVRTEAEVISIVLNGSRQDLETEKARTILPNFPTVLVQIHRNTKLLNSTTSHCPILTMTRVPDIQAMVVWKTSKPSRIQTLKTLRICRHLPGNLPRHQLQPRKAVNLALHSSLKRILRLLLSLFPIWLRECKSANRLEGQPSGLLNNHLATIECLDRYPHQSISRTIGQIEEIETEIHTVAEAETRDEIFTPETRAIQGETIIDLTPVEFHVAMISDPTLDMTVTVAGIGLPNKRDRKGLFSASNLDVSCQKNFEIRTRYIIANLVMNLLSVLALMEKFSKQYIYIHRTKLL